MPIHSIRQDWFSNIRGDVLAGLVVALALIPEAIAVSALLAVAQGLRQPDVASGRAIRHVKAQAGISLGTCLPRTQI